MALLSKKKSTFSPADGMYQAVDRRRRSHRPQAAAGNLTEQIVTAAAMFFAERGFEAEVGDLADQIGITMPQFNQQFSNKGDLIRRVYEHVFLGGWKPEWESIIADDDVPLAARVSEFYQEYAKAVTSYEWVRLFLLAGLHRLEFNARYFAFLKARLFKKLIQQSREEFLRKMSDAKPISKSEMEVIEVLHTKILFRGIKRHVFNAAFDNDPEDSLEEDITRFLSRMEAVQLERAMRQSRGHARS